MDETTSRYDGVRRTLYQASGFVLLLLIWQAAGKTGVAGKTLPALTDVLTVYGAHGRRALLLRATSSTASSAGLGLLAGSFLGIVTAVVTHLTPVMKPGLDRLAVVVNAVPAIALGPVFIITAGRQATPALLAAIPVFFLIYVAMTTGLRSADRCLVEFFRASGAGRWKRLLYLDAVSALSALLSGMKLAVTTAMIGAVVGEWFGAPAGLGIVILNTMQNFQIPLMWAAVLVVATISLTGYGVIGLLEQVVERRRS